MTLNTWEVDLTDAVIGRRISLGLVATRRSREEMSCRAVGLDDGEVTPDLRSPAISAVMLRRLNATSNGDVGVESRELRQRKTSSNSNSLASAIARSHHPSYGGDAQL